VQVAFVTGFSPIVRDPAASRAFYADALGLSFEGREGDYVFTEKLGGVKHLGLWPLSEAAQACFGTPEWPGGIPVPQATVEFEVGTVEAVEAAANELEARGYRLIHAARTEPWTQTITRLLSPEGLLVGVCYTPSFHQEGDDRPG
jgi:catechol 2,3-dioxygenase-like lactoylglutathione lyase family enzyme